MVTISIGVGNSTKDIEVGLTMTAHTNCMKGFTGIVGIITPPKLDIRVDSFDVSSSAASPW